MKTIGQSIKDARINAKMSIKDLAKATGISEAALYGYERDAVTPSLLNLVSIADTFNMPLDNLIGRRLPKQLAKEK